MSTDPHDSPLLVIEHFQMESDLRSFILEVHVTTEARRQVYEDVIAALSEFLRLLLDGPTDVSRVIDVDGIPVLFTAVHSPTEDYVAVSARLA